MIKLLMTSRPGWPQGVTRPARQPIPQIRAFSVSVASRSPDFHERMRPETVLRIETSARLWLRPTYALPPRTTSGRHIAMPTSAADRAVVDKLKRSRQLLSSARMVLEPDTCDPNRALAEIAGLVRFQGSEKWSLANFPRLAV
jgi:hypothetical protein